MLLKYAGARNTTSRGMSHRAQRTQQLCHLDGGLYSFEAFVAAIAAGAGEGLRFGVAGENLEDAGDARVECSALQAGGGLGGDVQVVVGLVADDSAEADDGVVAAGLGQAFGGEGEFEGTGDMEDVMAANGMVFDGLTCAGEQA